MPLGKDGVKSGMKSLEYVPQPEEKSPEYVPQPDDNFDSESEDDLLINCHIISLLPTKYDHASEVSEI